MGIVEHHIQTLYGNNTKIVDTRSISGGCINDTSVLSLNDGQKIFLKKNTHSKPSMFKAEAVGLQRLSCDGGPRVPRPIIAFTDSSHQYLLLEYLETGRAIPNYWERFAQQLATLHQSVRSPHFGFEIDNFIGSSPQKNTRMKTWISFFTEMRLIPQIEMAAGYLNPSLRKKLDKLVQRLDQIILEPEGEASLLHGDLWSGNTMVGPRGEPTIIDPATYFGHREAEIAMTMLFGKFGDPFYEAYNEHWPMAKGWQERMDLYNLYHMINHVNLFGSGYISSVSSITNRYL